MSETLVPLNDKKTLNKQNSLGSDKDLSLLHAGEEDTLDYRIHSEHEGKKVSLWHDISLKHLDPKTGEETPYYNFVCEIPKFTRKKYEIATDEEYTPIKQDEKKGKLREVCSISLLCCFKKVDFFSF